MKNYSTGRLPASFLSLGVMFFAIGVWRVVVLDWIGIFILVVAISILFITSGVLLDLDRKKIKKYSAFFGIKKGVWIDISSIKHLFVAEIKQSQTTNILSISRTDKTTVYKLFVVLPNKKIEIITGKKDRVFKIATDIAEKLKVEITNNF